MSGLKKKGKKALLRMKEDNKIKKKKKLLIFLRRLTIQSKKDKIKLEKKLRQAYINEESKEINDI